MDDRRKDHCKHVCDRQRRPMDADVGSFQPRSIVETCRCPVKLHWSPDQPPRWPYTGSLAA